MKFKSDIEVQAGLKDSSGALGLSGQILSSTSGNVSWVTPTVNTVARDVQNEVKAGVAINKGQAVYVTGADGTNIIVGLASNTSEATSSKTLGLLNATVAINGKADVVQIGRLAGLNTIGAVVGDPVWLGTNGNLIYGLTNKPYAPAHLVFIGVVTRVNASNGEIFITVQNGFELNEIHDVDLKTTVPINGDILGYNGTLWVNKTIAGWLGYTPANASGTVNYVSKFTGSTTLGNSIIFDNGTNVGIGTASPQGKLQIFSDRFNDSLTFNAPASFIIGGSIRQLSINTDDISPFGIGFQGKTNGNGATAIYFQSLGGNVGIGTTSPQGKLTVSGGSVGLEIGSNNTQSDLLSFDRSAGVYKNLLFRGNDFIFSPLDSERMRIASSGNVGIGTTSPTEKLTIANGKLFLTEADPTIGGKIYGYNDTSTDLYGGGLKFQSRYYDGANYIYADRLTIKGNGNVGIGTTSPSSKLSLFDSSDLWINISRGSSFVNIGVDATGTFYNTNSNHRFLYNAGSKEAMRILSNGNVGIGTTSPSEKFQIGNNFKVSNDGVTTWGVTNGNGILSWDSNLAIIGGLANTSVQFRANNAEVMRLATNGNVGIGTTSPSNKLDVAGLSVFNGTQVRSTGNGSTFVGFFGNRSAWTGGALNNDLAVSAYTSNMCFFTNNSVGESMRITSDGNVGIGTSTPGVKFVNSGGGFSSGPTLGSGTVGSQALLSNNGLYGMYSGVSDNGDVWQQVQRNDANTAVYNLALQPSGGGIYIGTNAPVYTVPAKINFLFNGLNEFGISFKSTAVNSIPIHFTSSTGTQTGYIFQDATGVFLVSISDYRLKEDLNSFNGLDLISKIKVYDYKWKDQNKRSFGVMAHELQEVVPQAAFGQKDGERMQGVDYSTLVPILIQAIKELKAEIEILKNK